MNVLLLRRVSTIVLRGRTVKLAIRVTKKRQDNMRKLPRRVIMRIRRLIGPELITPTPRIGRVIRTLFKHMMLLLNPRVSLERA